MADINLKCLCALILLSVAVAQVIPRKVRRNGKRDVADPVSNFFSELGDLFLDIDRSISVQTAPKVASQDNIVDQMFRPSTDYFNKVQENYKTLQNRLGNIVRDSIGPKKAYTDHELTTVGPIILVEKISTEASGQTDLKAEKLSEDESLRKLNPLQRASFETNKECTEGSSGTQTNSGKGDKCSRIELDRRQQVRESIERKIAEIERTSNFLSSNTENILKSVNVFSKRDGKVSNPDGRLLGDILYSESSFDKYIRQLLRDHGRWVLDNPLLSRWRNSENDAKDKKARTVTQTEIPVTIDSSTVIDLDEISTQTTTAGGEAEPTIRESRKLPIRSRNFYTIADDDDGVIEEEIDIVLSPLSNNEIKYTIKAADKLRDVDGKETLILAFTPSGVPLKLRMGPEIENPVRFLNTVLKSAGVSLNVPVESYDDIEPVGKEVMKYGAGVLTRAVYLDLSKEDELKSLLKTLMKSKPSKI